MCSSDLKIRATFAGVIIKIKVARIFETRGSYDGLE